MLGPGHAA
jgi:hypothetical protein